MGLGDKIRDSISGAIGSTPVNTALASTQPKAAQMGDFPKRPTTTGHVTSGLDQAMRDHADQMHPVKPAYGAEWDK